MATADAAPQNAQDAANRPTTAAGALAALGIVFGDLGTSPLYTMQTVIGSAGGHFDAPAALGMFSLIVWALIITISIKYCVFVMRADNHGEGGILALMSLVPSGARFAHVLIGFGLFGAALIYGDGVITPAISVLSALEGVNVATDVLKPYVVPAAVAILLVLFGSQTFGTDKLGRVFGPIMLLWFVVIGVLGLVGVLHQPSVLQAVDPRHAVRFLATHGWGSLAVLGGVFLAITGGEALYADMGHIGRNPIRTAWYAVVLPALLLSYAGQTALLIDKPDTSGNPFFLIAPAWSIYPLVLLATLATIIASQAIITGSFSLTRQAMQLGWMPGVRIRQTSDTEYGQIYVPLINWAMMVATIALTLDFGSSDRLAGAYGTAVSTTMLLTTALLFTAMRDRWRWPLLPAAGICGALMLVDLAFFAANVLKIADGGWIPLLLGAIIFALMTTWRRGVDAIRARLATTTESSEAFLHALQSGAIPRVKGSAVFFSRASQYVPALLVRHAAQIGAVHQTLVSLTVQFKDVPRVPHDKRIVVEHPFDNFWRVRVSFGFIEIPNLRNVLAEIRAIGCPVELDAAVYFAGRDDPVRRKTRPRLPWWRMMLFSFMYRNAVRTSDRFDLPPKQFVEIGRQVDI